MKTSQIKATLENYFEEHRIVVWNDEDGEFSEGISDIMPEGVELVDVEKLGQLGWIHFFEFEHFCVTYAR